MDDFQKLPESVPTTAPKPSLGFWLGEAFTVFVNGSISGLGAGMGAGASIGAATAVQTGSPSAQVVSIHAAIGLLGGAASNGVKRFVVWHDSHPFPNPFVR